MINFFKKLFRKSDSSTEDRLDQLERIFTAEQQKLTIQLEEAQSELAVFRQKEEADQDRYGSTMPWVEIKSDSYDPVKGIEIALDWNDAFVMYLKENGIEAKTEESAIQKWLAMLYQDIIGTMDEQAIEDSDIKKPSEFQ